MSDSLVPIFSRQPLIQAIIEAKVNCALSQADVNKVAKKLKKTYPNAITLNDVDISVFPELIENGGFAVNRQQPRLELSSNDYNDKVILSKQSIAMVRLAPYQGWDDLIDKFHQAWKAWKAIAGTNSITRIGVRNINRIDIPTPREGSIKLDDYMKLYPTVPDFGQAPLDEYQIVISQRLRNSSWSSTIASTLIPTPLINHLSLLFDIDVFQAENMLISDEKLVQIISEARPLKNNIFMSCITKQTTELFS